jgi:putative PEP-CTERM system TPR-repeat lipoprotein
MGIGKTIHRSCVLLVGAAVFVAVSSNAAVMTPEDARQLDAQVLRDDIRVVERFVANKEFDKALQKLESMQKKQPDNASVRVLKGAVYAARNDAVNARKAYEEALALSPTMAVAAFGLARLDILERKPEQARKRFEAILAVDRSNARAMIGLAQIAAAGNNEAEYVSWLEKAAAAAPTNPEPPVLLASFYLTKGDSAKAIAIARNARSTAPNNARLLDVLGSAQLAAGDPDAAVTTFSALVRVVPKDATAHAKLANALAAKDNASAARSEIARALALDPRLAEAKVTLASLEMNAGKNDEAMRIARELQKENPKSAVGLALEGDVLMNQKQFMAAQNVYERAFALGKSRQLVVKQSRALRAAGKNAEAQAKLAQWLQEQPNDTIVRSYLATSYIQSGQNKPAIEQLQLVVQKDPRNAQALNDLAWLYHVENDQRALATAEEAYRLKPADAQVMDTLGWILLNRGTTDRGLELLQKAVEIAPTSPTIHYHWAVALMKSGDKVRARRQLERLLEKNPTFAERKEAETLLKQL